jgi:hypothetical protein
MRYLRNMTVGLVASLVVAFPASSQTPAPKFFAPEEIKRAIVFTMAKGNPYTPCLCLKDAVEWCKQTTPTKWYYVTFNVSLISNSTLVGYGEGALQLDGTTGNLRHLHTNGEPWYVNEARDANGRPYNRPATQNFIFDLNTGPCTASIKIGNNAVQTSPPLQCTNSIYYAFAPQAGHVYVITLKKQSVAVPPPG